MQSTVKQNALLSLFALSVAALPLAAEAGTTQAPTPSASMSSHQSMGSKGSMAEGNCARMHAKGRSHTMKAKEGHCASAADIRAHGGKCAKAPKPVKHPG